MYRDRGLTRHLAERAQAAGYKGLVLTTDNQVLGQRERDLRNGFTIPPRPTVRNALNMATRLPWLWRMRRHRELSFSNYPGEKNDILSLGAHMADLLDPAASWADVAMLRKFWRGPLILKGVLHPDEARRAIAEGVDAVIVSNHGGRQLDGAMAPLRALPEVADQAGGMTVMLDGGITRGSDVLKALALGAGFVLVGRPFLYAAAIGGGRMVDRAIGLLSEEIDRNMALLGITEPGAMKADLLRPVRGR